MNAVLQREWSSRALEISEALRPLGTIATGYEYRPNARRTKAKRMEFMFIESSSDQPSGLHQRLVDGGPLVLFREFVEEVLGRQVSPDGLDDLAHLPAPAAFTFVLDADGQGHWAGHHLRAVRERFYPFGNPQRTSAFEERRKELALRRHLGGVEAHFCQSSRTDRQEPDRTPSVSVNRSLHQASPVRRVVRALRKAGEEG